MDKALGTNCVQAVRSTVRNHEDRFPHLPHYVVRVGRPMSTLCTKRGTFTAIVRAERTEMYTGGNGKLTVLKSYLSSISTEPTITTTTYI